MVLPPAGPPPPSLPEGWKAHFNAEYKTWFYENIYTEESVWEKPTQPVYPPQSRAALPPGPPPGYQAVQQPQTGEKGGDVTALPSTMAAVSLSDGNQYPQPSQQQPSPYGPQAPGPPTQQAYNPVPPPNTTSPQPTPQLLYGAPPQLARAPSPQTAAPAPGSAEVPRDYSQGPQYPPQATYPTYQPQQPSNPGYPPQPQYSPQPNYSQQPQYSQGPPSPQPPPAQKAGGFMGMLQNKVGSKVPGGAGTVLGLGGGLLAGAVMEHEWDKHEDRERRHHHGGGFGGLGGLMRGFGGDSGGPVVENVTINEDVYVDNNDSFINF